MLLIRIAADDSFRPTPQWIHGGMLPPGLRVIEPGATAIAALVAVMIAIPIGRAPQVSLSRWQPDLNLIERPLEISRQT